MGSSIHILFQESAGACYGQCQRVTTSGELPKLTASTLVKVPKVHGANKIVEETNIRSPLHSSSPKTLE